MAKTNPFNGAYIGCHASITPSITAAIKYIHAIGANALQIFAGSTQSSGLSTKHPVSDDDATTIRQLLHDRDIRLNIHAIYLLNFCTAGPTSPRLEYARANLAYDIHLAQRIGAFAVVLHLGNHLNKFTLSDAETNQVDNILAVLHRTYTLAPDVCLLLETPAGQGTQIGTDLTSLGRIFHSILKQLPTDKQRQRIGVCLDTAHIFSAGVEGDITTPHGWSTYMATFDKHVGLKHLRLIHLNDSKLPLASKRDLHTGIADGHIFPTDIDAASKQHGSVLHEIVQLARNQSSTTHHPIPIILETHKAAGPQNPHSDLYAQELGLLATIAHNPTTPKLIRNWRLKHHTQKNLSTSTSTRQKSHDKNNTKNTKTTKNTKKRPKSQTHSSREQKTPQTRGNKTPHGVVSGAHPGNAGIIERLVAIRDYYDLPDTRDRIRQLAYAKAVVTLQNYPEEIRSGEQVRMLDGIGAKIALKIDQLLEDGEMKIMKELDIRKALDKAKEQRGKMVDSVLGIGPSRALGLRRKGIVTVAQLRNAVSSGKVALPPAVELALAHHDDLMTPIGMGEARKILGQIRRIVKSKNAAQHNLDKHKLDIELAGSFAAGATQSKDVDILIISRAYDTRKNMPVWDITDGLRSLLFDSGMLTGVINVGKEGKLTVLVKLGGDKGSKGVVRHVDMRVVCLDEEVTARMYFTSGRLFNQVVRARAKSMGFKLNEFGLYDTNTNKRIEGLNSESDVLAKLELDFIPLQNRRG